MSHQRLPHWVTCPACGKRAYDTRRDAKAVREFLGQKLAPYECPGAPDHWHLGHRPRGGIPRVEITTARVPRPPACATGEGS